MKYNRQKLIDQANARIKELKGNGNSAAQLEYEQKMKDYRLQLIDATSLYLKALKRWKPIVESLPSMQMIHGPYSPVVTPNTSLIKRLEGYIKQLETLSGETFEIKNNASFGVFFTDLFNL